MKKIFRNVAKKIINILDEDHSCSEIEYLQMLYGIQNILYNIVIIGLMLFLSYITKTFIETLLLFIFLVYYGSSLEDTIVTALKNV